MQKKVFFLFIILFIYKVNAQVGINNTSPDASSILDVTATDKGVLLPRVSLASTSDVTTIASPETSLLIYNTNAAITGTGAEGVGYYYYNGSNWVKLIAGLNSGNNWYLSGNAGTNSSNNFVGTTDAQSFVIRTNNIERMRMLSTGNIGIGIATAPARLTVSGAFTSPTFPNTTTNAIMRIGNNSEGLDIGKGGISSNYAAWLQSGFNGNSDPLSLQPVGGFVGIGTTNPSNKLHIVYGSAAFRLEDGTQAANRVLTSDANGVGTWQPVAITNIIGTLGAGVNIAFNETANYLQTGTYITLPPGRWAVNVTMLMRRDAPSVDETPANSSFWLRSTLSDSNGINPTPSPDIIGSSNLVSGNYPGSSRYSNLFGTIFINNTSGSNKTYYYVAGRVEVENTTDVLFNFGGSWWLEDQIYAIRISN